MTFSRFASLLALLALLIGNVYDSQAQKRLQYPAYLSDAFFSVNVGYINYPFSNTHLDLGFQAQSIVVPHEGVRLMLYGRDINKYLGVQVTYMRPVLWVLYKDINGERRKSVWMNIAGLSLKPQLPLGEKLTVHGEVGLSIITRHGFKINNVPAIKDANYASILLGGGLKYHLNDRWGLTLHGVWSPENKKAKQPYTFFFSPGFQYNMRALSDAKINKKIESGHTFPLNQVLIGYATNGLGYGVNSFFSDGLIPVFWGGSLHVERGIFLNYRRNVFHGRKIFALDFGAAAAWWQTEDLKTDFYTLSVYPLIRFTLLRLKPADFYFFYSVAGPTYISQALIDGVDTGTRFTFHDFMGIGIFAGDQRQFTGEVKIGHYSNGNLFPQNGGVKIPLTFSLGYNF
jgi:hypothetical protein